MQGAASIRINSVITFLTSCKLVIGNYKDLHVPGLYNANIWMSTALWGISSNAFKNSFQILRPHFLTYFIYLYLAHTLTIMALIEMASG